MIHPGPQKPKYGFDAPGIMVGMFLAGSALAFIAWILPSQVLGLKINFIAYLFSLLAVVATVLSFMMLIYGLFTKRRIRDYILDQVSWRGDEKILDIGTGRGLLMIGAAKRLTIGKAIGIDIWSAKDLSGNTQQNTLANIAIEGVQDRTELRNMDARKLEFPDQSIDIILSLFCIHNIEDKADQENALKEIVRVVKPGGKVIIGEWMPTHGYAKFLADEGLVVESSRNYIAKACSLTWIMIAKKPL